MCMVRLLQMHGEGLDYAYYLADLCHLIPSYQCKQTALTTIRTFFEALRMQLLPQYVLRVESSFCSRDLRRWARREITEAGAHRPHWRRYIGNRMTIVDIPMSSWKLKLVNIQRACKDYVWDDASSTLPAQGRSFCEGHSSRARPFGEGHSSLASVDASGHPQVLSLDMLTTQFQIWFVFRQI